MHHTLRPALRLLATLAVAIVYGGPAPAQQLTSTEVLLPVGQSVRHFPLTTNIPWDTLAGAGVLWDYAWITADSTAGVVYTSIPVAAAPDAGDYPGADHVIRRVNGVDNDYVVDQFFDTDGGLVRELGSVGPVLTYVFDGPETQFAATMDLADTLHGAYCFGSDGFGVQYHFCGDSYVTFDAMGTLVLPFGTYTDVKHVTHWRSTVETTTPDADTSYTITQQWYVAGTAFPMLEALLFIASDGTIYPSGRIMDLASLTGLADRDQAPDFQLYPNPAAEVVTIQRNGNDATTIDVITMDGRLALRERFATGEAQHTLAINALPAGSYVVRVAGGGAQRLIKE